MAARRKLPDADAFGAMLDMAFPDGPLSDGNTESPSSQAPNPQNQTVDQPVNQTIDQTVIRPVDQPVIQTDIQTDRPSDSRPDRQTVAQPAALSDLQPVVHLPDQPIVQPAGQPDSQSVFQTVIQTVQHPDPQTVSQTVVQPATFFDANQLHFNDPVRSLTKNQCRVLLFLMSQPGITQRPTISEQTGVAFGTVKDALAVLVAKGFIGKPQYFVQGDYRGISYMINKPLCDDFIRKRGAEFQTVGQPVVQTVVHPVNQTINQPVGQSDSQTIPFSSSRNELKTTTTENGTTDDLLKDPELGYWREKGVNNRQINAWSEEFQMPIDQVLQSLRYCRFDMVVLNQEEEKQISNPMNWFYKVMQRSGLYPKPTGYKSLAEIRAEQMEQAARDVAEARERQVAAEHELAFQKLMSNPDSEEYRRLLANVDEFAKDVGGKVLETALREAFRAGAV